VLFEGRRGNIKQSNNGQVRVSNGTTSSAGKSRRWAFSFSGVGLVGRGRRGGGRREDRKKGYRKREKGQEVEVEREEKKMDSDIDRDHADTTI
jgi:hypothetical protein